MASISVHLSFIALIVLATGCNPFGGRTPASLAGAVAHLEETRSYAVDYRLTTYFDGTPKPVVAAGRAEFEGMDRFRLRQESIEMVSVGGAVYVNSAGIWQQVEEIVDLPVSPFLYLKAAESVRRTKSGQDGQVLSFTVGREKYRQGLEKAMGRVPTSLERIVSRFSAKGEVTLDAGGRPRGMDVHLENSALGPGKTRQDLEVRFVEFGAEYHIEIPVVGQESQPLGRGER